MKQMTLKTLTIGAVAWTGLACPAAGLTPGSYVQDGLVVQLDAIDNTGTGTHNASATVWSAVKGGVSVTLQGNAAWTGRYLDTTPTNHYINGMPEYRRDSLTIETAINIMSNGVLPGKTSAYPRIFANGDNCTIHFDKSGTTANFYMNLHNTRPYVTFRTGTIAAYSGSERYAIAVDGVEKNTSTYPANTNLQKAAANWNLNGYSGYLHGHYYAFRYYDRMLSMEELKQNATIDKLRFWSYTFTGAGGETDWSAVSWIKPEGAVAAAPSTGTNAFVQIANAEVNVSAADNVGLAGLSLEDGATLDIADGAVAAVKALYVEGVVIPRGFYKGSGTGANVVSWLKGNGILRVAGAMDGTIPDEFLSPGADGWYEFGLATGGEYNHGKGYSPLPNNSYEWIKAEYVDWGRYYFPAGGANKVRLVGYVLMNAIPPNTFSVVDLSQAKMIQLYSPYMFEDGTPCSIPSGAILRYQPGTWKPDNGKYWQTTVGNAPFSGDIELQRGGTLYVTADNGHKWQQFTGFVRGTGTISMNSAYSNHARISGGFSFNGSLGGLTHGSLLWIDSLAVTSRLNAVTFSPCSSYPAHNSYRLCAIFFGRHGSDETADHDLSIASVTGRGSITASGEAILRTGGLLGVWGGNKIRTDSVYGRLHVVAYPQTLGCASGFLKSAVGVGTGNLEIGNLSADDKQSTAGTLYMGTNVNVVVGTVAANSCFDYDTFISNAVNSATLDITNSCDATATVLARDIGTLPARLSGFTGTVTLSDASTKSYTMPIDMTQGTDVLYNTVGCIGSGTLAGAPANGAINATFPTDVPPVKGQYALARFTSGGEALANWTVTLNGQALAEQPVAGNMVVSVVKDTTGLWLNVARSGMTIIIR